MPDPCPPELTPTAPVNTPPVEPGDDVLVYRGLNHEGSSLAVADFVTPYSLKLTHNGTQYSGVRYRKDPILKSRPDLIVDAGGLVWDEAPRMKRLREVEDLLKQLSNESPRMARLRELEDLVKQLSVEVAVLKKRAKDGSTS